MDPHLKKLIDIIWDPDIYNIATALRGPDSWNSELKRIFTARIRALVGLKPNIDLSIEVRESSKIELDDIVYAILNVSRVDYHYLEHVKAALSSLSALLGSSADRRELEFLKELAYLLKLLIRDDDEQLQVQAMDRISELLAEFSDYIL